MKQYYITTLYSQGSQVSIQQDHALKEMLSNMEKCGKEEYYRIFNKYKSDYKTTVSLGMGQPLELLGLYSFMYTHKDCLNIPFGLFQEPSLNYTPTCLTFVTNEKLSIDFSSVIRDFLRELNVKSLYDIKYDVEYTCPFSKTSIKVVFDKDKKPSFLFTFDQNYYKGYQNNEVMPKDLNDKENIYNLYKELNKEDFLYYNNDVEKDNELQSEIKCQYTYSLAELIFMLKIRFLRLK